MKLTIFLMSYAIVIWIATCLLARAYAPADGAIQPPPPRPPMVCGIVAGKMKCEVR